MLIKLSNELMSCTATNLSCVCQSNAFCVLAQSKEPRRVPLKLKRQQERAADAHDSSAKRDTNLAGMLQSLLAGQRAALCARSIGVTPSIWLLKPFSSGRLSVAAQIKEQGPHSGHGHQSKCCMQAKLIPSLYGSCT